MALDPLRIGSLGYSGPVDVYSIVSLGYIAFIEETIIPPVIPPEVEEGGGGGDFTGTNLEKQKKRKKIKVRVKFDNYEEQFEKEYIFDDLDVTVDKVSVTYENERPNVHVTFKSKI